MHPAALPSETVGAAVRKKAASAAGSRGRLPLRHLSRPQRFHRQCAAEPPLPREAERLPYGFYRRCGRKPQVPWAAGEGSVLLCNTLSLGRGALCAPAGSRGRLPLRPVFGGTARNRPCHGRRNASPTDLRILWVVRCFHRRCGLGRRRGMACLARLEQARPFFHTNRYFPKR